MKIEVDELIYTRAEAKYSRQRYDGYQVYFSSPGISSQERQEIETAVRCLSVTGSETARVRQLQSFRLSSGRWFIASSTPVSHIYLDSARPKGPFIAHGVALSQEQFERLGMNPFHVLDQSFFIDSAERLVEEYLHRQPQDKRMLVFDSFELDDDDQDDVDDASSARFGRLKKVLCSIIPSHRASESGATLWLYGENSAINDFLRRLFHIATDDAKRWMTFSTHVDGCRLIKGLYWAVGTAKPPGSTSVWIDVATGEARLPVTGPGEGRSHYYRWLADVSERLRWKEIATLAPAIERLTDALATSDPSAADDAPDQALEEFQATVGVESLSSRLESWLRQRFSPKATADLLRSLQAATALREYVACALSPTKRLESLLSTHVACWLARGIAEGETPPASPDDWRAIARIQRYASSPRLDFLASVLSPQSVRERWLGEHRRDAARVRALTSLSDDEYEELWHDCGAREPGWFVCPSLIERLWRVLADWRPSEDEVARLLIALAKFDRQPPRELFERWIAALSPPRAEVVLMAYLEQSGKCRSLARALARRCPARSSRVVEALRFIGAM